MSRVRYSLFSDTGSEERQEEVPQPVRGTAEGNALRANPQGERLAKVHPGCRTPEYREGKHVENGESNEDVA